MDTPQEACGVVFDVKLSFSVVDFVLWILPFPLRLKLAQAFQYALPFRRLYLLFLGGFLFFPDLPLPCGKVRVVRLHNSLRFVAVGCHERLHIRVTALF